MYQAELDLYMETDEADYTKFSEGMATRRRQAADEAAPPPTRSIGKLRVASKPGSKQQNGPMALLL